MSRDFYADTLLLDSKLGIENMRKILPKAIRVAKPKTFPLDEEDSEFEGRPCHTIKLTRTVGCHFLNDNKILYGCVINPFRMIFNCREWTMTKQNAFRNHLTHYLEEEANDLVKKIGEKNFSYYSYEKLLGIRRKSMARAAHICQCWPYGKKMKPEGVLGVYSNSVFDRADSDILNIMNRTRFFGRDSLDYSVLACNKKDVVKLFNTTPSILTLFCALKHIGLKKRDYDMHFCDNISQWCQDKLKEEKIYSKKLWRFLLQLTPYMANALYKPMYSGMYGDSLALMQIFSDAGSTPRYTTFRRMVISSDRLRFVEKGGYEDCTWYHAFPSPSDDKILADRYELDNLPSMIRAMSREKRTSKQDFFVEYLRVMDWMRAEKPVLDHNQKKAGWSWYTDQQQAWHNRFGQAAGNWSVEDSARGMKWESALEEFKTKNYCIVPLVTGEMLVEEGQKMHHCVASYAKDCSSGRSIIFSIRDKKNKRLATLQITKHSPSEKISSFWSNLNSEYKTFWCTGQVSCLCNAPADSKIKKISNDIALRYTKAFNNHLLQEAV